MSEDTSTVIAIHIHDLVAGYGSKEVLHNVSLNVGVGKTYGLIGLNGAGKTTLVKTILGLKKPGGGAVEILGKPVSLSEVRYDVSYLPERFDPPWFLKGGEFIDFAASLYGRTVSDEDKVAFCDALALDVSVLGHKVQTYSKGMRQKLGLIATVLTGGQILIFDEPMSGLDPLARSLVKKMFLSLKEQGKTVLLSSHILSDMDEICDLVSVIHTGNCLFSGQPRDLREQFKADSLEQAFLKVIEQAPSVLGKVA